MDLQNAWRTMVSQHTRTSSPNAGWTMAATAGALEVRLEKNGHYALVGGPDLPENEDIPAAIRLVQVSAGLAFLLCLGVAYGFSFLF